MISAALLAVSIALPATASPRVVDRIAAVVNEDVILFSELEERGATDYKRALEMPFGEARDRARAKALKSAFDQLVAERLLAAQVAALQVEVTEADIDTAIEETKRRYNLTSEALQAELAAQGSSLALMRKSYKKSLEEFKVLSLKVRNRVKVSDEDIKNYYQTNPKLFEGEEEIHVRDVFLAIPPGSKPAEESTLKALAEKTLGRLKAGESFVKVAKEVSQGPSANDGGDLGWLRHGTLHPDLARVGFAMKPKDISGVIRTKQGFHILMVEERRMGTGKDFEKVKEEIRDRLTNEQIRTFTDQYVAELRKDALIDVKVPELRN